MTTSLFRSVLGCALMFAPVARAADQLAMFAPLTLPTPVSQTRSAGGVPGPAYWQNRADYHIDAAIDTANHTLTASETITYTNNSPDTLDVLWLQLDQNIYRQDSRANTLPGRGRKPDEYTNGNELTSVTIEQNGRITTPTRLVSDTRMQLRPATPLPPHAKVKLHIAWHYTVPGDWGGRTAFTTTPDGDMYEIAQWFPRMAVYDDVRGWDTAPYLGAEFYLEYGDIDYAITLPSDYIVAGSGALTNPAEALTPLQRQRLAKAAASDATVPIRSVEDVAARTPAHGTRTWRFHMSQTRDVAFAASPAFVWDAARINLPGGSHALAQSVYPRASAGKGDWPRSTEYVKFAIEHFSARYFPYPWPSMTNVGGHGAGMEYPGIVFDDKAVKGKDIFWITVHEVGHSWFPMIVGSNERRDAFMDEGFNTFIDVEASDAFNHGEFGPKRDSEYAPGGGNPADEIAPLLADTAAPIILTPADQVTGKYRHSVLYYKPAFGLHLLRDLIIGPARFDPAFRRYIAAWAYRHPTPSDFFRLMQSEAGEDLSWFWRGWFFSNSPLHVTIAPNFDITSLGPLVLPVPIEITHKDGTKTRTTLPVEAFMQGGVVHAEPATTIVLDPDHLLPIGRNR